MYPRKTCTQMFAAASFIITKTGSSQDGQEVSVRRIMDIRTQATKATDGSWKELSLSLQEKVSPPIFPAHPAWVGESGWPPTGRWPL